MGTQGFSAIRQLLQAPKGPIETPASAPSAPSSILAAALSAPPSTAPPNPSPTSATNGANGTKRRLDDVVLNLHLRRNSSPTPPAPSPPTAAPVPKAPRLDLLFPPMLNHLSHLQKAAILLANHGRPPLTSIAPHPTPATPPYQPHSNLLHLLSTTTASPSPKIVPSKPVPSPKTAPPKKPPVSSNSAAKPGCELTTPKLSRHNDAAYYPNIQCILCSEWVCSRNRYMHIESHLQYRPYKCSICLYDNRKEIFIQLHLKRTHKGEGRVLYEPDAQLEQRAWQVAEQCLQHTREVLMAAAESGTSPTEAAPDPPRVHPGVLEPYRDVYRPKIYNSQRAEKSQLIEESRQLGLVPDFSEVAAKEELCRLCSSHILRHHIVLEEHVRTHLPSPTYQCNIQACSVSHESKNFIARHMKEVHKYRRQPLDLLEERAELVEDFLRLCAEAFPDFFDTDALRRIRFRYSGARSRAMAPTTSSAALTTSRPPSASSTPGIGSSRPSSLPATPSAPTLVLPRNGLTKTETEGNIGSGRTCQLCQAEIEGTFPALLDHILSHVSRAQFLCVLCARSEPSQAAVMEHAAKEHPGHPAHQIVQKILTPESKNEVETLMKVCFPGNGLPNTNTP